MACGTHLFQPLKPVDHIRKVRKEPTIPSTDWFCIIQGFLKTLQAKSWRRFGRKTGGLVLISEQNVLPILLSA